MTWLPDGAGRMFSPAGDSREREVRCGGRSACRTMTWAFDRICDACHALVCDCPLTGDGVPECVPEASAESWEVEAR